MFSAIRFLQSKLLALLCKIFILLIGVRFTSSARGYERLLVDAQLSQSSSVLLQKRTVPYVPIAVQSMVLTVVLVVQLANLIIKMTERCSLLC